MNYCDSDSKLERNWYVYLLRCKDNSLYCGITTDLLARVNTHNAGKGSKYITGSKRPAVLIWSRQVKNRSWASVLESEIKQLSKAEKELLVLLAKLLDLPSTHTEGSQSKSPLYEDKIKLMSKTFKKILTQLRYLP